MVKTGELSDEKVAGLRLTPAPFVPEIRLYLAEDAKAYRAGVEAQAYRDHAAPFWPPFWACAWAGGQCLARYLMDRPELVEGRRVLDIAAGSGIAAIAAARSGAADVLANDVDRYALAAVTRNAAANGVTVRTHYGDLLDGDGGGAEVVLAGDVFYSPHMAQRMTEFLERVAARGARVLVGDPGRPALPLNSLEMIASYRVSALGAPEDSEVTWSHVLSPIEDELR